GIAIVCQGLPTALGLFVQFGGGPQQHFGLYVASQILSFVGYLIVTGASIRVVSQAYLGHEPSMGDALDFALSKMGRSFSCVFTLFYYDLRVRKEAFDLELLSQHLGIAAARA